MSEEILKALTQLFAIITKQDEGVTEVERKFVVSWFKIRLAQDVVNEYLTLYEDFLKEKVKSASRPKKDRPERPDRPERAPRPDRPDRPKKSKLTSVKDSVRTLAICKKINKTLTQKQKVIVLIELLELVNSDKNFTSQRREIINTVSTVFNISKEEYEVIEKFVLSVKPSELDVEDVLIVADEDPALETADYIHSEALDGSIHFLKIKSVDLYFLIYNGHDEMVLNNRIVNSSSVYLFSHGSNLRPAKGAPVYYSDIVSRFNKDSDQADISFNVKGMGFQFPNGHIGLRNINITEEQGKLLGIMGASGAGKTTLLNVLAGIEKPSSGAVLINGVDIHKNKDDVEGVIGYIAQDDILIEDLTVFENLYYNARLCFKEKSDEEIRKIVHDVLNSLGLEHIRGLKVGNVLNKKISGGQRKRLNIALELIREPAVMFVDEPTSGLSSRDSENVIDLLKELSLKGKLIFVVIHQPSSDIYKMFDKMYIMDTGGYPIFYGNPVEAIIHFKKATNQINAERGQCNECGNVNPEQLFDLVEARVVNEYGRETSKRKVNPQQWADMYNNQFEVVHLPDKEERPPKSLNIPSKLSQWFIFTLRDVKSKISNTQYLLINLLQAPLLAALLAFIVKYNNTENGTEYVFRNNQNLPAYLLMSIVVALFMGLTVSAEEIIKDRKILKREKFLNLSRNSYLMSKMGILFSLSAIQTLMFAFIGNFILEIPGMYLSTWLLLFSVSCFANILGLNISSALNSAVTVYIIIPLLLIPQMVLSGALFNFDKLNDSLAHKTKVPLIADMMVSRWAYEAIAVDMYKHNDYAEYFYGFNKMDSEIEYKESYLKKVEKKLTYCAKLKYKELKEKEKEEYDKAYEILSNELALIVSKQASHKIPFPYKTTEKFAKEKLDFEVAKPIRTYLHDVTKVYSLLRNEISATRNKVVKNLPKLRNGVTETQLRKLHDNEALDEVVRRSTQKSDSYIVEENGYLVRNYEPIFQDASGEGMFSYRAHFFAPNKKMFHTTFETFWFNVCIIWLFTFVLYISLYFDLLRLLLESFSKIRMKKD